MDEERKDNSNGLCATSAAKEKNASISTAGLWKSSKKVPSPSRISDLRHSRGQAPHRLITCCVISRRLVFFRSAWSTNFDGLVARKVAQHGKGENILAG